MTTIKKIAVLVSIVISFLPNLPEAPALSETGVQSSEGVFSFSAQTGMIRGQAEELVYKFPGSDLYLSELLWDIKPFFYAGLASDFGPQDPFEARGISASLSLKLGIPFAPGTIEDRDWLNDNSGYLTHYSRHDSRFKLPFFADISAGYSWNLSGFFALKVFGEFSYMRFSWDAEDGYVQYPSEDSPGNYPPWNESLPKLYLSGKVIRYVQNWYILSPGVSLKGKLGRFFSLEGSVSYTPLIYASNLDEHLMAHTSFRDYLYFGHSLKAGGGVIFSPAGRNMDISLHFSYRRIHGPRGDTHSGGEIYKEGGGAGYTDIEFALAAKFFLAAKAETRVVR